MCATRFKKIVLLLFLCAFLFVCAGCGSDGQVKEYTSEIFAMDTYMSLDVYCTGQDVVDRAAARIREIEDLFSVTDEQSEIYAVNENGSARVSEETTSLLERTLELCKLTDGALDISIYPVARAWGFTTEEYRIPDSGELSELLKYVDYSQIQIDGDQVTLGENMMIDLGSVVKGYTGDEVVEMLSEEGVTSALLNLGGDVRTLGAKPNGNLWNIAIRDPNDSNGYAGIVSVENKSVVTSGGYERYFEGSDGEIYWHIIDPATGSSARSGLISVTIVSDSGLYGDALATALFVMGETKAVEFWRERQDFDMILITDDGRLLATEGLEDCFEPDGGYQAEYVQS